MIKDNQPVRKNRDKDKLAVTIWNYKGGVGKTTVSLILSEIAAQEGLRVLAADLDEQENLHDALKLTGSLFPAIDVRKSLEPEFVSEDYNFFIVDTHPTKNEDVKKAFNFSDVVLIPVMGDYLSVVKLRSAFNYVISAGVGAGQVAMIKNCMTGNKTSTELESVLDKHCYASAGRLPRSNALIRNIAAGESWDKFMRPSQRKPFLELYDNLWTAYERMSAGDFKNLWS